MSPVCRWKDYRRMIKSGYETLPNVNRTTNRRGYSSRAEAVTRLRTYARDSAVATDVHHLDGLWIGTVALCSDGQDDEDGEAEQT